ncbi:nuclear pore complex protein Nup98-Nup96-like [Ctenocephalides felis]|uniref:nuclear pore complex protein Nup98-Nup96-like n=1 Tax=Ctenocephalides felis TaxID=7515 RepID=UPI000E6E3290|nr:nuclear pore complex protein Nup98-Nup96-like [Ctenocephalides felis]
MRQAYYFVNNRKPATAGFSATPTVFGASTSSTSLFGNAAQPATGLFGTPAAAPAFGAPSTTQSFGFGQPAASTSLFGGNAPGSAAGTSGSLFGAGTTTSAFGQPNKGSTFGFGATPSTGSLFGQTASTQAPTTTGLFGQSATTQPGTGLFGNTSFASGSTGTVIKFNPVTGTDMMVKSGQSTSINTKHHCITCMKEYEGKSLEELRLEDYMANRKGPQSGGIGTSSPFGMAQPQTGLFGQQATSTPATGGIFGQQENKSLFGSTTPALGFGSTTPAFGATTQSGTSSLFGAKPTTAFGAQPAATTTSAFSFNTNTFGANTQAKPFGTSTPQTGLFGQPATSTFGTTTPGFSGFGTPTTQSTGLFGAKPGGSPFNMPASTSTGFGAFGQTATTTTATSSLFGAKPATTGFGATNTGFGTPATSTGFGGFGQTTTSNSLFNNTFNKPATSTFGFGNTSTNTTLGTGLNLGGTTNSLFGGTNTAAKPGGLFGTTNPSSTGLFGSTNTFGTNNTLTNTGLGNTTLGTQQSSSNTSIPIHQQMILISQPFGDSPLFKNLAPASGKVEELLRPTNPTAQKAVLDNPKFKLSTGRDANVKIKPLSWTANPKKTLFDGLEEYDPSIEVFSLKPNPKRLVLTNKSSNNSIDNIDKTLGNESLSKTSNIEDTKVTTTPVSGLHGILLKDKKGKEERRVSWLNSPALDGENKRKDSIDPQDTFIDNIANSTPTNIHRVVKANFDLNQSASVSESFERRAKSKSSFDESEKENLSVGTDSSIEHQTTESAIHYPTGITLTRTGYYTIPSLDKLSEFMTEDNQCIVPNFTVGREGYGNVYFNDSFDVANLNLDEIVHFRHKEVIIYPDDDNKPPVGVGLNRKAQVTLDRVWPHDKNKHEPITDPGILQQIDYEEKLRRVCAKHDTRFLEYRPQTGSWVFKVDHFSKYGLSDSEDEEVLPTVKKPVKSPVIKAISDHIVHKVQKNKIQENGQMSLNKSFEEISKGLGGGLTNGDHSCAMTNGYDKHDHVPDHFIRYQGLYPDIEDDLQTSWTNYNSETRNEIRSPTTDIVKESGQNNHKLQLMKASFFIDDDDDDDMKSVTDNMEVYEKQTSDQIVPKALVMNSRYKNGNDNGFKFKMSETIQLERPSEKDLNEMELAYEMSTQVFETIIIRPTTVVLKNSQYTMPYKDSLASKLTCLSDASLYNGRRFKNGWGSQNLLLTLTTKDLFESLEPESNLENLHSYLIGRQENDCSTTLIQAVQVGQAEKWFEKLVLPHMDVQLDYTEIIHNDKYPKAITNPGVLEAHYEVSQKLHDKRENSFDQFHYNTQVWDLVKALWGYIAALEGLESSDHIAIMCRRRAFSEWLERWSALETTIQTSKASENKDNYSEEHLETIINLLSQHKIEEATDIAQENGDYYLSMLLSQISSGPMVRELLKQQLISWRDVEGDLFISPMRLRAFLLVAGIPVFESTHGMINICEGLDWKRSLAVHLWYISMPTASIADCLQLYEKAFKLDDPDVDLKPYACSPDPPYHCCTNVGQERKSIQDLCFHLLKLNTCHSHTLESLLNPATHTPDALDYRLSWFLQQTLKSIGYGHSSELSQSMIHTSFASQLETNGLWHWAVFVLLHIESDERRAAVIKDLLDRHVSLSMDEDYLNREKFILEQLNIPSQWLYNSKALLAGNLKQYRIQAECFINGNMWNEAHTVIMRHLAPDDFINGEIQNLKNMLSPLAENSVSISGWSTQGEVLWDFLDLESEVQGMLSEEIENLGYHMEILQPRLSSLCSRVILLPCPTSKHRLCQSEISKKIIGIVRGIVMQANQADSRAILKVISQLPMPEDYSQHELRSMIDNFTINFDTMP